MLLDTNPEYQAAVSRRTTGIVLASVLGGAGGVVGVVAGMVSLFCYGFDSNTGGCLSAKYWTIGGFVTMGVGLAVGIPLAVSAHGTVKRIRNQAMMGWRPRFGVGFSHRGAGAHARWEF
jgi:hypothetical protein